MKCPRCKYEWKLPGPQAGGLAKVAKGFAVAGQPDDAARKRAWKTRKALAKRSPNNEVRRDSAAPGGSNGH